MKCHTRCQEKVSKNHAKPSPTFGNSMLHSVCQLENDLCTLMVVRSRLPFVRYVSASLAFLAQWTNKSPKKCNIERPHVQCTCHILLASKPRFKKKIWSFFHGTLMALSYLYSNTLLLLHYFFPTFGTLCQVGRFLALPND